MQKVRLLEAPFGSFSFFPTTMGKIFEPTSSFHVKYRTKESIFQQYFASIDKSFILGGRVGTRL